MNLSGAYTTTTVEFFDAYRKDDITLLSGSFSPGETARVVTSLDRIRERTKRKEYARVVTSNTFPKGVGAAASASGFAALTVAAFKASGTPIPEKELTIFARLGSGSACRSIPDGFVLWENGRTSEESYAYSLHPAVYWDIRDILVIVDIREKKVSTTDGMRSVSTSPLLSSRLAQVPIRIAKMKTAFAQKNFEALGILIEEDCLDMHRVMQTQAPPVIYWNEITKKLMSAVTSWRKEGIPVYFTIDAGPNVHLICEGKDAEAVTAKVREMSGVLRVIANTPARGAYCTDSHLF